MIRLLPKLLILARVCLVTGGHRAGQCTAPHQTACTSLMQQTQRLSSRSAHVSVARQDPVAPIDDRKDETDSPDAAEIKTTELHSVMPEELHSVMPEQGIKSAVDTGYWAVFPSVRWDKRGRPQLQMRSIVMMLLMPSGICLIMYCTFLMIRYMEDHVSEAYEVRETHPQTGKLDLEIPGSLYYPPLTEELVSPAKSECSLALPSLSGIKPSAARYECDITSKIGTPIVRVVVTCMADADPESAAGGSRGLTGQVVERLELISAKRQNRLGSCELQVAEQSGTSDSGRQLKARIFRHTGDLYALLEEVGMPGDAPTALSSSMTSGPPSSVSSTLAGPPTTETTSSPPSSPTASSTLSGHVPGVYREFLLTSATGAAWKRRICGNVSRRNMSVTDEAGNRIINVERGGSVQNNMDQSVPMAANSYKLRIQPKVDAGVVIAALLAIDRFPRARHL